MSNRRCSPPWKPWAMVADDGVQHGKTSASGIHIVLEDAGDELAPVHAVNSSVVVMKPNPNPSNRHIPGPPNPPPCLPVLSRSAP